MPEDPKTVPIDTAALLEKQRELSKDNGEFPKTVAIDGEQLAQRLEAARREREVVPTAAPARGFPWVWVVAVLIIAVLASYLLTR